MNTDFYIELQYRNEELKLPAAFISSGYSYKIDVDVDGKLISFEPDEERNFRAVSASGNHDTFDKALLAAIAEELITLFRKD